MGDVGAGPNADESELCAQTQMSDGLEGTPELPPL
jgi:hypothetical protein